MLALLANPAEPLYGNTSQETTWKKTFMLRRTKEMISIPPITVKHVWIEMNDDELQQYNKVQGLSL